ncbi:uncharacterized protein B0I36DRAFT_358837 [Microdochium trichocladiopsis]|uniref:Uncharacterized protein n=1 Tax=Microdochium trichocladiopsis TaxID=1682393 RepID=A0A9P8YDX2_9PEZI|nr:uncharacterized protein B0I36DRAFT_358837 [Microdochium trichocladiopsis]KAH7037087.1 hypothetical protein B0I36DRAFT_358837 [Microdochium trichocladiopsis]
MEAAGIVHPFSDVLVIKAVSDFADSHKNDDMHGPASLNSPAVATVILEDLYGPGKQDGAGAYSLDRLRSIIWRHFTGGGQPWKTAARERSKGIVLQAGVAGHWDMDCHFRDLIWQ